MNGTYTVAYMDPTFPTVDIPGGDALFTMTADGQGNLGTINVNGYTGTNTTVSGESLSGVTYSFSNGSNGAAQINFGGNSAALVQGTELLYVSPDGNFVFGGNSSGFDMFVGVRSATSNPANYDGLYYQAGMDLDIAYEASQGYSGLDGYYGAINAFTGNIIGHQRLAEGSGGFDLTYFDSYMLNGDGSSNDGDFGQQYWSTPDGSIRIGYTVPDPTTGFDTLGINIALQAPAFSGPGVYLNPVGMENAASSAPFTAQLSPGEYLTLIGTNLAPSAALASSLPLTGTLNGVSVTINGIEAPVDYVSPTQINVVVPYYTTQAVAQIQVNNNGKKSNVVTQFVGSDSAGVFTYDPVGGIGNAAALHADNSLITDSSPAQIGEPISVYLGGMGIVTPAIADGVAPTGLTTTTSTPVVYIADSAGNSTQAAISYSGLAPGFPGLYQLNITIPSGVASGQAVLDINGSESENVEAILPVGTPTSDATPAARAKSGKRPFIRHHRSARPRAVGVARSILSRPLSPDFR